MVIRLLSAFFILLLMPSPASAGFSDGMSGFRSGNYADANREWQLLAESGHAKAQTDLGLLFSRGLGVDRDPTEAVSWYLLAA